MPQPKRPEYHAHAAKSLDTLLLLLLLLLVALSAGSAVCPTALPEPSSAAEAANTDSAAAKASSNCQPSGLLVTGNSLRHDAANANSCRACAVPTALPPAAAVAGAATHVRNASLANIALSNASVT
jgi:hypothetical protein